MPRTVWHCASPEGARKGRTPSCARVTAVRAWWSSREKLEAGGPKRPRRSCGRWLAPTPHLCRDRCTAVPELLGAGVGRASWPVLRRGSGSLPFGQGGFSRSSGRGAVSQ